MRAVVLGGTGAVGGATAARLISAGWDVEVTGRNPAAMPTELRDLDVRFHQLERADTAGIQSLVGDNTDLMVDLLAYCGRDVRDLLPAMASVSSVVLLSSRAVYVDSAGRHVNSDEPPQFGGVIGEDTATVTPAGDSVDPFSRFGYAASKVAAEHVAMDSGLPVTVIRAAKIHGPWARNPRTDEVITRMQQGSGAIRLGDQGRAVDQLTAAANTAALIEVVAGRPGRRVLNNADPDTPNAAAIMTAIADELGWSSLINLLPEGVEGDDHPWLARSPVLLDTTAAVDLGYRPVGPGLQLLRNEVRWLLSGTRPSK